VAIAVSATAQTSLWKITDPKSGNFIYLGGTIHLLRESDYPMPQQFDQAFNESEMLVFETDIDVNLDSLDFDLMTIIRQNGLFQGDTVLKDVINPETYSKLQSYCQKNNIQIEQISKMKPSMIQVTIVHMATSESDFTVEGTDLHYFKMAKDSAKQIEFLESPKEQINALFATNKDNYDKAISALLDDLNGSDDLLAELVYEWRNGKSKYIQKEIKDMKKNFPNSYQFLQVNRNNNWLIKFDSYLETKPTECILVGYMHLIGKEGLLKQMKSKGYKIEQQ